MTLIAVGSTSSFPSNIPELVTGSTDPTAISYTGWCTKIKDGLVLVDLSDYPDGTTTIPADAEQAKIWKKNDGKALALMRGRLGDVETKAVENLTTSKEVWDELKMRNDTKGRIMQINLFEEVFAIRFDTNNSLPATSDRIKNVVKQIYEIGMPDQDTFYMICLLTAMDSDAFMAIRSSLNTLFANESLTHTAVEARLAIEEERLVKVRAEKALATGTKQALAAVAATRAAARSKPELCGNCKKCGHLTFQCWSPGGQAEGNKPQWIADRDAAKRGQSANVAAIAPTAPPPNLVQHGGQTYTVSYTPIAPPTTWAPSARLATFDDGFYSNIARLTTDDSRNWHATAAKFPVDIDAMSAADNTDTASRHFSQPGLTSRSNNSKPEPAFSVPASSKSKVDWEYQKTMQGSNNDAIDDIMDLVGLEDVKAGVLNIQNKIDVTKRQSTSLKNERFNTVLLGNAGTGKSTVARLYAKFLMTAGALPGTEFVETSGSRLATDGVPGAKKLVEYMMAAGGAIFIDEAYQLTSKHNFQGGQVLDFLLSEMENNVGTLVFILAGYNREMESFFEHNPGLTSRVPIKFQFADYTDGELLEMFQKLVGKRFSNKMKIQDGPSGLSVRIAVRRLAQGRGRPGFGNVRALQNMFAKVLDRQAARLTQERKHGKRPDDFLLVREDLIGPDPSKAIRASRAWNKLQKMIGLGSVKDSIRSLIFSIQTNYKRELKEEKPIETSLNRVFTGNPGTGKTAVAKLYGQILADLGLLSNGEVVIKNPSDFIGASWRESEMNTKAILATTVGKILIIDEAYMLYTGTGNQSDPYHIAVIDTIVAEVQNTIREDRCVLLLGNKEKMEVMFQNVNPGLARRFRIKDAFQFEDFSDPELLQILDLKLKSQDLDATPEAKCVAIQLLSREKNKPNFGNGGAVENLLSSAKSKFLARQSRLTPGERSSSVVFLPVDVHRQFDRATRASSNLQTLFSDVVGREDVINKLAGYQDTAFKMKARGMDARERIPMNFVFKGPAGTGKTTIARKLGQVFYDMGFLSSTEVVEASTANLVAANYVGQTGTKIRELFEKALGKVLFIDEAYRLGEGYHAKEAVDEIVGILTNPKFMNKLVLILAGYDREMDQLLSVNTGLSSRFSETIMFTNMSPDQCLEVLAQALQKSQVSLSTLQDHSSADYCEMQRLISDLSIVGDWGNARDMMKLSNNMVRIAFTSDLPVDAPLSISRREAIECINEMLVERRRQANNVQSHVHSSVPSSGLLPPPLLSNPFQYRTTTKNKTADDPVPEEDPVQLLDLVQQRDAGVSDAVWSKSQADKHAEEMAKKNAEATIRRLAQELQDAEEKLRIELDTAKKLAEQQARDTAEQDELKREVEEIRVRELMARNERGQRAAELEARRKEEQRHRQEEAKVQAKLRDLDVCDGGYRWIKQAGGYRCSAGGHFIGNAELGI